MRILISVLLMVCLSGCTWQQRNELRFVFMPWDWTPPTPRVLLDTQDKAFDVQVSVRNLEVALVDGPNGEAVPGDVVSKQYCWGTRIGNDVVTSSDIVAEVNLSSNTAVRQLRHKTHGDVVWSGFIKKPYKIENGLAYWKIRER